MCLSHGVSFYNPRRWVFFGALIVICVGGGLFLEWITTPSPQARNIHIEAFRYGTSPSIIRANRGDLLTLTFSTRDTGHSFFLQDYRIDAKISPASKRVEVRDPLDPQAVPLDAPEVYIRAGLSGFWGNLISISRFRCHVYCGLMHGFEQGDLIVRPNWLLAGSMGMLAAIVLILFLWVRGADAPLMPIKPRLVDLNGRSVIVDRLLKWRPLQFLCTLPVLACFMVVLLGGFFGTKVGGRNIAVMLTWVGWMTLLTIVLVPLAGRIWCLVCPLPVLGEYLQRGATIHVREGKGGQYGNRFFGLAWRWPSSLQGPWLRLFVFVALGTLSASLAGQPLWTSAALLAMMIVAVGMSLIWELRAFCRFLCPVATYVSAYSSAAPILVSRRNIDVCRRCKEKACLKGNADGWACPYGLCVATMKDGSECGMCTECFKSCPHNNVTLAWRKGPWLNDSSSYGHAWQWIALLVVAAASSLTLHSPWPQIRDMVNVVDKATWSQFALYALFLSAVALVVVPGMLWFLSWTGIRLSRRAKEKASSVKSPRDSLWVRNTGDVFRRTLPSVIPLGIALWVVFFASTIMVNFTFLLMTLSDPFGRGWDLFGTAGMPWVQIWPGAIPWLQAILTLVGFFLALRKGFSLWLRETGDKRSAFLGFCPTAGFLVFFAGGMLLYFTNY